jgi:hypothetical protein
MEKCFRCGKSDEEDGAVFSHKTPTTPSSICMACFAFLKIKGPQFLHEKAKIEQDDPNYDIMKDGDYIKNWNKAHPIRIGNTFEQMRGL